MSGGGQQADYVPWCCSRLIGISRRWGWARHLHGGWLRGNWIQRRAAPAHAPIPDLTRTSSKLLSPHRTSLSPISSCVSLFLIGPHPMWVGPRCSVWETATVSEGTATCPSFHAPKAATKALAPSLTHKRSLYSVPLRPACEMCHTHHVQENCCTSCQGYAYEKGQSPMW